MSKPTCEAVEAQFAWWAQQCSREAVTIVDVDGEEFWVCAEHQGVAR